MEELVRLVGIAKLAAEGTLLAEKRRVDYRTLPTRKWLNRCDSQRVPFNWSINPYRGCEYGCKYCYARFTHEFLERHNTEAFETEIYAKDWDALSFKDELRSLKRRDVIGIGTATDPYQPAERRFRRTREVLQALRSVRGTSICITTKSDLISRDVDLLQQLLQHNDVHVAVTVTTMNAELARMTEPFAPRPDLRMKAVAELSAAAIPVSVLASPVLPLITDSEEHLREVAIAAKNAGAVRFGAHVLFLKPSAQRVFFPFLSKEFPEHIRRYEASYRDGAYLKGKYPDRIRDMVTRIRERVGIGSRDLDWVRPPEPPESQMLLF